MMFDAKTSKLSLKKRIFFKVKSNFKKIATVELSDSEDPENPEDVKERLQKMELFEKKLEVQRNTCAFGVILSVALYFLIWYFSKCWAFPFQESPCKQPRALPLISTNQSTLADAVDEFTLALRAQIAKFRDGIEISHLAERQALSNTTKNEIRQLFSNYSADLAAFGALKREDTRIRELEAATSYGSTTVFIFLCISILCMGYIAARLHALQSFFNALQRRNIEIPLEEGSENLPNVRLKPLKKRIPKLYIATSIYIAVGVTLFMTFSIGHYYSGSSPAFMGAYCDELILNRHFAKLDSFMSSPILEVRQTVWLYEIDVIDAAIEGAKTVGATPGAKTVQCRSSNNAYKTTSLCTSTSRMDCDRVYISCHPLYSLL